MNQSIKRAVMPLDETLITLIENREEKGYSLLYEKYWDNLVNYTFSIVRERFVAEEIVQNLLVSFYTRPITIKNRLDLLPYLYKAVRNRIKNYYRGQQNYNKYITYQRHDNVITTDMIISPLHLIDLQNEIKRCLSVLPYKYTQVFLLNREHCLTIKEISRHLNRPEGTIEKQLRKVLQYLKENIDHDFLKRV